MASAVDGFVPGSGVFRIPYDPAISREISIYVSGCLEGGTLWYFDTKCAANSNPTSTLICGNGTAQDLFDKMHPKYHHYPKEGENLSTVICDTKTDVGCSIPQVFNTMLQQANFIAPTKDAEPVTDCKVTWVSYLLSPSPIVSKINRNNYSITNYTLADYKDASGVKQTHWLHPGKVVRRIKLQDGKVIVTTEGEGTGRLPGVNESAFVSSTIWNNVVDEKFKKYWDSKH